MMVLTLVMLRHPWWQTIWQQQHAACCTYWISDDLM
jgi:hypothetical protein